MYNINEIKNTILQGNCLSVLKLFPDNSIDCIITSSPYYGLRSYGTVHQIWGGDKNCNHNWNNYIKKGISGGTKSEKVQIKNKENFQIVDDSIQSFCLNCNAWKGELGQEPTHLLFIEHLTEIFMECSRVLKPDGTMWLNIADTYAANRTYQIDGTKETSGSQPIKKKQPQAKDMNIIPKSLIGIPDRLKISLIDNQLICRNEIIWHKPNQMPVSTKDRFTNDFEKLYLFTKSQKYFFIQQIEQYQSKENHKPRNKSQEKYKETGLFSDGERDYYSQDGRNMRTLWSINTKGVKDAHFATFPEELPKRCILAGCPENGIVLDPFFGSGTTGLVAKKNNRNYIGIELNPEYIEIANGRLGSV